MSKFRKFTDEELEDVPWAHAVTVRWPDGTITTEALVEHDGEPALRPLISMHGVGCRPIVYAHLVELWERDILEACPTAGQQPEKQSA